MDIATKEQIKELAQNYRFASTENEYETDLEETINKVKDGFGYDITVEKVDEDDFTAIIEFSGNSGSVERVDEKKFIILLNPFDSELRRRFTLAHELGHVILDHLPENTKVVEPTINILNRPETWKPDDEREKQANAFAAELLMPEDLMHTFFNDSEEKIDFVLIEQGSKKFNVSKSAIMTRLNFLNLRF